MSPENLSSGYHGHTIRILQSVAVTRFCDTGSHRIIIIINCNIISLLHLTLRKTKMTLF